MAAAAALAAAARGRLRALLRPVAWPLPPVDSCRRLASDLPKHLLPGSYPKTSKEWAAAAKKYNLTLEDYKTYADDGVGYGDYPKLPDQSLHERNPWYDWDQPELRRNFGEPLHRNFDLFVRTRVDTSPTPVSWHIMKTYFWGFLGIMLVMFSLGEIFPTYPPVAPKQYPYGNLENRGDPNTEPVKIKHYEI
ncbi:NADH dehydrogenase [ubiquinone] 1 beta subcomplex subunit 8, mitochondrial [Candoia aspera]|uniref:NADH dehydrogenase [ubiquinone] 1 beta subcomplex subunit 8, mitochondrial n=1 Tax=Candoia aspera TaxID=51853 RepID=UPI002FD7EE7D